MRSYASWIDGLNQARYCARHLKPGIFLELTPDPGNPYDEVAVALYHAGHHIGYIPERDHWIARALDKGETLACMVMKVEVRGWFFRRARHVELRIGVADRQTAIRAAAKTAWSQKLGPPIAMPPIEGETFTFRLFYRKNRLTDTVAKRFNNLLPYPCSSNKRIIVG